MAREPRRKDGFEAVLANDSSRITADTAGQRMDQDLFVAELPHKLYRSAATRKAGSTPLHLAVAPTGASGTAGAGDLQLEIIRMLLAAGATLADTDRNGITVAGRINSQALRDALAAGQLLELLTE